MRVEIRFKYNSAPHYNYWKLETKITTTQIYGGDKIKKFSLNKLKNSNGRKHLKKSNLTIIPRHKH